MVGLVEAPTAEVPVGLGFSVAHQKVNLDIDLLGRRIHGRTEIVINPSSSDLKTIRLNCRQVKITRASFSPKSYNSSTLSYEDPYARLELPFQADVHHYHRLQERLDKQLKSPPRAELEITVPKSIKIYELDSTIVLDHSGRPTGDPLAADLTQSTKNVVEQGPRFSPITVYIDFVIENVRDGMQFVGWGSDDMEYPHAYTHSSWNGTSSCLFPCVDSMDSRCTWELSVKTPRTIGDALAVPRNQKLGPKWRDNGSGTGQLRHDAPSLSDEDRALDLSVISSGDMTDEIVDPNDPTKKTTSFICSNLVSPQHIGFAIGPFVEVNLAAFRESDEDDKLGRNAVTVHGFCLPGRAEELTNICFPIAKAMDYFVITYGSYPFSSYKLCFVDDMARDHYDTASLSLCSSRLLFPEDVIDPIEKVTRELIFALASQWIGVNIIPRESTDLWAVVGIAYYVTDMFIRKLAGNNDYRYQQKLAADRVCELDVSRLSIHDSGAYTSVDPSYFELIAAKAPLVLFILDRRLTKASGSTGLSRIISRIFLNANVGDLPNGALSTAHLMRTCEKLGHTKLDVFFNQWVFGAGCPRFRVTQRFNKKRLVVEMQIAQEQNELVVNQDLESNTFMREVKEDLRSIYAPQPQYVFSGPMTIRIHEADGTPYEHIVEIKEATTRFDIPYNTKYKRLKRSRRQRERTAAGAGNELNLDGHDDVLLYCLGDVLQSEEDMRDWKMSEWSKDDEERMSGESYEWIRMDADFEWICQMTINMPGYMYVSQLQQDRDVVAQYETVQYLAVQKTHPLISTILIRTLMDGRYFHGIRTTAADALSVHAKEESGWLGLFHLEKAFQVLFCISDSSMTRSNDFSDRASYYLQCAIPRSIAKVRDCNGRSPFNARRFLYEKLRYNDNSNNEFSDCYYLSILMQGLAEATASAPITLSDELLATDYEDNYNFYRSCLDEIDRHRRLDEWVPSHQNVLSTTALNCRKLLAKAGSIEKNPIDFLRYTQNGTLDELRIAAFSSLLDLGYGKNEHVTRLFFYVLGSDPSPYVRSHLLRLFGKFLGSVAIGEDNEANKASEALQEAHGLVIEQESTTEARKADLARKQTVSGAITALKSDIGSYVPLKAGIWEATNSSVMTISEISELLLVCDLMYEPTTSMTIMLSLPRYWRVVNQGRTPSTVPNGKPRHFLRFTKDGKVRTKPFVKIQPPPVIHKSITVKRENSGSSINRTTILHLSKPVKRPQSANDVRSSPIPATPITAGEKPKLKLIFKAPKP